MLGWSFLQQLSDPALVAGFEAARAASGAGSTASPAHAPHQVPTPCEQCEMLWFSRTITSERNRPSPPILLHLQGSTAKNCLLCYILRQITKMEVNKFQVGKNMGVQSLFLSKFYELACPEGSVIFNSEGMTLQGWKDFKMKIGEGGGRDREKNTLFQSC